MICFREGVCKGNKKKKKKSGACTDLLVCVCLEATIQSLVGSRYSFCGILLAVPDSALRPLGSLTYSKFLDEFYMDRNLGRRQKRGEKGKTNFLIFRL